MPSKIKPARGDLAEEAADLAERERRAVESRLEVLIVHLLKWRYQRERRGVSRESTIGEQRYHLAKLLRENPSLRLMLPELLAGAYPAARLAAAESGLPPATFPETCPFALDELLAEGWLPG